MPPFELALADELPGGGRWRRDLSYGEPSPLPEAPFLMGRLVFDGWATLPGLPAAGRVEGRNYFPPGAPLSEPGPVMSAGRGAFEEALVLPGGAGYSPSLFSEAPAPPYGGAVELYAQWRVDLSAPGVIAAQVLVPARVPMAPAGAGLWSAGGPAFDPRAVRVALANAPAGGSWPEGGRVAVSLARPAPGAPLLSLASSLEPGAARAVEVLRRAPGGGPEGAPYDPGDPAPGDPPEPLVELLPAPGLGGAQAAEGFFYLRAADPPWAFAPGAYYEGALTFRVDWR